MKGLLAKLIYLVLMAISFSCFADKILLTGRPVVLMPEADYYTFPNTYVPSHNFHFVNVSGDNRVCFLNQQPQLTPLDLLRINIVQNNKKFLWYCYRYDPRYFTVDY
ncbi:hypothetical protein [Legionella maceachernii]|uniref:Uncharacterized protein n=1 Tax=Legionella maceachernii TaxID=466 RepID=A0A0W0VVG0_9GAMM|nr:hypothetical protein [Legionella maceachernii]KTD24056.1 hypothetical protein Lmac_2929 [Legionella maceachernii]SJZ85082.1 hypothetical protein SAMN02745128_01223 [Legionella maceachernii]SUO99253.1 Uncharacterised protein [Legionella maceachernii]